MVSGTECEEVWPGLMTQQPWLTLTDVPLTSLTPATSLT